MDLDAIIREYRRRGDDNGTPPFAADPELAVMASEAEREAAVRACLLLDDSIEVEVVAGQAVVPITTKLWRLDAADFTSSAGGRARALDLAGMDWVREQCDWRTRTCTRPDVIVHLPTPEVRLWPAPSTAGTLRLSGYRYPLYDLEDGSDEPEIPEEHHDGLVDWLLYRVYSTKDGELEDPARADRALGDFTRRFGERPTADVLRRQRERRRITTRYGGIR